MALSNHHDVIEVYVDNLGSISGSGSIFARVEFEHSHKSLSLIVPTDHAALSALRCLYIMPEASADCERLEIQSSPLPMAASQVVDRMANFSHPSFTTFFLIPRLSE